MPGWNRVPRLGTTSVEGIQAGPFRFRGMSKTARLHQSSNLGSRHRAASRAEHLFCFAGMAGIPLSKILYVDACPQPFSHLDPGEQ